LATVCPPNRGERSTRMAIEDCCGRIFLPLLLISIQLAYSFFRVKFTVYYSIDETVFFLKYLAIILYDFLAIRIWNTQFGDVHYTYERIANVGKT